MSQINFILGFGERLTEPVQVKHGFGEKIKPYSLGEARERLGPQFDPLEVGMGRISEELMSIISCHPGVVRVLYHGNLQRNPSSVLSHPFTDSAKSRDSGGDINRNKE